jgi:hypothetical protein
MRLTLVLAIILVLTYSISADAKKKHWCRVGETPKTHNCDYLGSGIGG